MHVLKENKNYFPSGMGSKEKNTKIMRNYLLKIRRKMKCRKMLISDENNSYLIFFPFDN